MRSVHAEKNKRGCEFELQMAGKEQAGKGIYFELAEIFNLEVRGSEQAGGISAGRHFVLSRDS